VPVRFKASYQRGFRWYFDQKTIDIAIFIELAMRLGRTAFFVKRYRSGLCGGIVRLNLSNVRQIIHPKRYGVGGTFFIMEANDVPAGAAIGSGFYQKLA
jgi:hypothetical protein